jgi:prevent-host-death family protein
MYHRWVSRPLHPNDGWRISVEECRLVVDQFRSTTMRTVGAYEAKTHLPRLLDEVARGETITITKHGVPVAKLVPPDEAVRRDVGEVIKALREFRKGKTLGGISIRELIEEGRRY